MAKICIKLGLMDTHATRCIIFVTRRFPCARHVPFRLHERSANEYFIFLLFDGRCEISVNQQKIAVRKQFRIFTDNLV